MAKTRKRTGADSRRRRRLTSRKVGPPRHEARPVRSRQLPEKVGVTLSPPRGGARARATLRILDEWVLLGDLSVEELHHLRRIVKDHLHLWDPSLEVWVPTPSLLFRLSQAGLPDLSTVNGFRRLAEFRPLAVPALDDAWLWRRTTLGAAVGEGLVFGVRKAGDAIYWLLPLEDRAFFQLPPAELSAVDPGLFGVLGVDRLIQFLRAAPSPEG